jgi:hypothetical protein
MQRTRACGNPPSGHQGCRRKNCKPAPAAATLSCRPSKCLLDSFSSTETSDFLDTSRSITLSCLATWPVNRAHLCAHYSTEPPLARTSSSLLDPYAMQSPYLFILTVLPATLACEGFLVLVPLYHLRVELRALSYCPDTNLCPAPIRASG